MILKRLKSYLLVTAGALILAQGAGIAYLKVSLDRAETEAILAVEQARRETAVAANNRMSQALARAAQAQSDREAALMGRIRAANQATREAQERADQAVETLSDFDTEREVARNEVPEYAAWADQVVPDGVAQRLQGLVQSDPSEEGD